LGGSDRTNTYEAAGNVRVLVKYLNEELKEGEVDWEDC